MTPHEPLYPSRESALRWRLPDFPATPHDEHAQAEARFLRPSPLENVTSVLPSFSWSQTSSPTSASSSSSGSSSSSKPPSSYLPDDPLVVAFLSAVLAASATYGGLIAYRRGFKRIRNVDSLTSGMLERRLWIKGSVTSVGDGDNFRLFHTPLLYRWPLKLRSIPSTPKELKDETLHIRIAGVDAPEAAHFGNPAQPHSAESLDWLRRTLLGKSMSCQLLRKDQYNRVVAVPYIRRWYWRNRPLPLMMLREGMAVVYTSGGGEYGPWGLEQMQAVEAEARRAKRGLWKLKKFESPAEYKKRVKAGDEGMVGVRETARAQSGGMWGLIKRILGR